MKKLLVLVLMMMTTAAFAQAKFGHINSSELMRMMPELDSAEQKLQVYAARLEAEMRSLQTDLENFYNDFTANQNEMTDLIKQTKIKTLQDKEARLQDFQNNAKAELDKKQQELFNPIIEKAKKAISEVAKENKFAYIFDTTSGTILFSPDTDDITPLVKKKLGLK